MGSKKSNVKVLARICQSVELSGDKKSGSLLIGIGQGIFETLNKVKVC